MRASELVQAPLLRKICLVLAVFASFITFCTSGVVGIISFFGMYESFVGPSTSDRITGLAIAGLGALPLWLTAHYVIHRIDRNTISKRLMLSMMTLGACSVGTATLLMTYVPEDMFVLWVPIMLAGALLLLLPFLNSEES